MVKIVDRKIVEVLTIQADPFKSILSLHLENDYGIDGFAKLCFSTGFGGRPILQRGDLQKFWNSMGDARNKMKTCKIPCGISHSVRRESATIK